MRRDIEEEVVDAAVLRHDRFGFAEGDGVIDQNEDRVDAADTEGNALRSKPGIVGPDLARKCRIGMRRVVPDERLVCVGPQLTRRTEVQQQLGVGIDPQGGHGRNDRGRQNDPDRNPADAEERRRQLVRKENRDLLKHVRGSAGELQSCPAERQRQLVALAREPDRGTYRREIACASLIAIDEFVGLFAGEPPLARQFCEPHPVAAAGSGKGIDVHLLK